MNKINNQSLTQRLDMIKDTPINILAGFDGFVDTLVRPVKNSINSGNTYFETIKEFGEFLVSKAGKSCSLLLETQERRLGGNAPIFSKAAASLGQSVTCIGALGNGGIDPVFDALRCCSHILSVAEPGQSTALEFNDGKILLAQNADIDLLDYDRVQQRVGQKQLSDCIAASDMVALLNWSELERASALWDGILVNCLGGVSKGSGKKMLVDLCDCSRKSSEQIDELLGILRNFSQYFTLLLTLNENEAELLGQHMGLGHLPPQELIGKLHAAIGVQLLVIHTIPYACAADGGEPVMVPNSPVAKPVISTGAGDHFNGGLAVGWGHNFSLKEMLTIANHVTGIYVSTGTSPTLSALSALLSKNLL